MSIKRGLMILVLSIGLLHRTVTVEATENNADISTEKQYQLNEDGQLQLVDEEQLNELNAEFENAENGINTFFSEWHYVEQMKKEKIIWGVTIAVLVIAIFVVGMVTSGLNKMNKQEKVHTKD